MSPEKKFELGDYVEVRDRIARFYDLFGQGRLVTSDVQLTREPDDTPRVIVTAKAYRTPDDPLPGVGTSWLALPGSTPYTRGSEIENAETSAWGRAIGSLGILIDRSIASSNEIENKREPATVNGGPPPEHPPIIPPNVETETLIGEFSRKSATVRRRDARTPIEGLQGPDGHVIALRLEMGSEKSIPQVVIAGNAGEALYLATSMNPDSLVGANLSVKGLLYGVTKPGTRGYNRLKVREWATVDYAYPAEVEPTLPEPPPDVALVGERPEAPTAPLFDDVPVAS